MNAIQIPQTLDVVVHCWDTAEGGVRATVASHAPGLDEPEITSRLHEAFARGLDEASGAGRIEAAFLEDLRLATRYEGFSEADLRNTARGLVATAALHPGETEARTGGDLGLVIVRPQITRAYDDSFTVRAGYRRGLLCQAKLRRYRRRWGKLTVTQERVLPDRLPYLALLLYRYLDRYARDLNPFEWQMCAGHSLADIKTWLKDGSFQLLSGSQEVLRALGTAKIGTADVEIIDTIVAPKTSRHLEVRIDWPDGGPPGSSVRVLSKSHIREVEKVRLYAR